MVSFAFEPVIRPAAARRLARTSDGDTPVIEQPIRMVSIDTPEKAGYAGLPATAQLALDRCRTRLADGTYADLPADLREYLIARLKPDAAQRHIAAGVRASQQFDALLSRRLTRPDGGMRRTAVIATGELLDGYGRLLAYLAPWFAGGSDPVPPRTAAARRTFNLDMVASGWAASFVIYPSLPRNDDLNMLLEAAERAWEQKRGMWAEFGADMLLAYEFRACVRLGAERMDDPKEAIASAYRRICIDLRTLRNVGLYGYHQVPPAQRLWIWEDQFDQARRDLDLPENNGV